VHSVAIGALPDGTPVIVSASGRTVWLWRLADGNPLAPPLDLPESLRDVAIYGDINVTATEADISAHQPALP
jgi:hypothetical protein